MTDIDWHTLARDLQGPLVLAGDPQHVWARKRFVALGHDTLPAAVAYCVDATDVAHALRFARSRQVPFAVRATGHSFADHSSTPGLLIDVSRLTSITPTAGGADAETVTVGAGVGVGELVDRLTQWGRSLPTGSCPTVGIAGLTLAGGFGLLGRDLGLTTDHLRAAEVVLADGSIITVDDDHDSELWWALRGIGGAHIAVVTTLTFHTLPVAPVTTLYARWPFQDAVTVIDQWQRLAPEAPDQVTAELLMTAPDLLTEPPTVELFGTSRGDPTLAENWLAGFVASVGRRPTEAGTRTLNRREAARYQAGWIGRTHHEVWIPDGPFEQPGHQLVKSEFFDQLLPVEAIAQLVDAIAADRIFVEHREVEFIPWQGAYARVSPADTAFVHRRARLMLRHTVLTGSSTTPQRRQAAQRWLTRSWEAVHPYGSGRVYQGYPDPELADWADAYYGANLPRLAAVKATYDPDGLFVSPQPIPPHWVRPSHSS